jgi:UDP-3-O-[3-hydroxymyristoyl] glucosamine N-acyltransferase
MQEQFLALMHFIKKARCWLRSIAFRRGIKDNVGIGHFVQSIKELGDTLLAKEQIDNQVHVGHDTVIGKNV